MPIPPAKDMDWPQKQRMMHMRLRRIVLAHNDMFLQVFRDFSFLMIRDSNCDYHYSKNNTREKLC